MGANRTRLHLISLFTKLCFKKDLVVPRTWACLNGEFMPAEEAKVSIWDRGFLFADAVYEVFRLYGGRCWLEAEHLARLRRSLAELELPHVDLDALRSRIERTIAERGSPLTGPPTSRSPEGSPLGPTLSHLRRSPRPS